MKYSNDTTGNRTRDLPACSAGPQPTAPQRTPERIHRLVHLLVFTRVLVYHNARNEKYVQYGAFVNVAMIFTDP